jgi:hypothetical protein
MVQGNRNGEFVLVEQIVSWNTTVHVFSQVFWKRIELEHLLKDCLVNIANNQVGDKEDQV